MKDIIARIKKHAEEHYNDGGWDVLVECWGDGEYEEYFKDTNITTFEEAFRLISQVVSVWAERQDDARNSAF